MKMDTLQWIGMQKRINPVWLWYSTVLLFPPVHELGHAGITMLFGDKLLQLNYASVVSISSQAVRPFQTAWDYLTIGIFLSCVILWVILQKERIHSIRSLRIPNENKRFIIYRITKEVKLLSFMLMCMLVFLIMPML